MTLTSYCQQNAKNPTVSPLYCLQKQNRFPQYGKALFSLSDAMLPPAMKRRRCLPCHLIIRNIGLLLVTIAVSLVTVAEIHAAANKPPSHHTAALRRLVAYQIMLNFD